MAQYDFIGFANEGGRRYAVYADGSRIDRGPTPIPTGFQPAPMHSLPLSKRVQVEAQGPYTIPDAELAGTFDVGGTRFTVTLYPFIQFLGGMAVFLNQTFGVMGFPVTFTEAEGTLTFSTAVPLTLVDGVNRAAFADALGIPVDFSIAAQSDPSDTITGWVAVEPGVEHPETGLPLESPMPLSEYLDRTRGVTRDIADSIININPVRQVAQFAGPLLGFPNASDPTASMQDAGFQSGDTFTILRSVLSGQSPDPVTITVGDNDLLRQVQGFFTSLPELNSLAVRLRTFQPFVIFEMDAVNLGAYEDSLVLLVTDASERLGMTNGYPSSTQGEIRVASGKVFVTDPTGSTTGENARRLNETLQVMWAAFTAFRDDANARIVALEAAAAGGA